MLDKKSKLRNYFEKSKLCGSVACYPDNEITIRKIVEKKLNGYSGLTPQIINTIIRNSDLNRNKVNNEIEKIITFFKDKKIDADELETLLNLKINDDFDKLRDEALNGNKNNTNRLLADTVFDTENNFFYLNSINQRINKLNEIEDLKKNGKNVELAVSQLKPPIFWKDKPIIKFGDKKKNTDYRHIDLFSGCGGFSEGFIQTGFSSDIAIDIHPPSLKNLQFNHPSTTTICGDIKKVSSKLIKSNEEKF